MILPVRHVGRARTTARAAPTHGSVVAGHGPMGASHRWRLQLVAGSAERMQGKQPPRQQEISSRRAGLPVALVGDA
jgi:hypothetical protein